MKCPILAAHEFRSRHTISSARACGAIIPGNVGLEATSGPGGPIDKYQPTEALTPSADRL
jgi:hypothetical protein